MGLAEALTAKPGPTGRARCSMGRLIESLDETTVPKLSELKTALGTPDNWGLPAPVIFKALAEDGRIVSLQQINRHRGGSCGCDK